jgi:uncharacterized low-complexity protein
MQSMIKASLTLALILGLVVVAQAEEKKEEKVVEFKGTLGCPKCVFKVEGFKKCGNAIKVKDGDKETLYILDDMGGKEKYHAAICTTEKTGVVKGVVVKKKDVLYIKPEKDSVKYD